ncbi:MAG: cofactor-independent phosphoglycerate mutase [Planctomycetota bacterium]|nr:MAG: cofactor-independent phosphoglycerate mutase [Planctomycetota bacterium]
MKYAVILPDGAADEPLAELDDRTPLEAARTPHMDWIAAHGRQGRVVTVPDGFRPGSDVATLSLFGYDPRSCYTGRAPLEAAARGLHVAPGEIIFRCNFVTITEGTMVDFTAGHISTKEASQLIAALNASLGSLGCTFHAGVSYRNLMVASAKDDLDPVCTPPHDIPDEPVAAHLPKGKGARRVREIMERAREVLATHEVNEVRRDLGENPATDIWLWGQGRPAILQPFRERYGVSAAAVAAVDLIRGLARSVRVRLIDVKGATGYLDTDYAAKGRAAAEALDDFDLVFVHIEAPDEAGHQGDAAAKLEAIERIDEHVVGPLLERLRDFERWRILVAPDHPTPVVRRVHTSDPPPFCLAGTAVPAGMGQPFSERYAARSDLQIDPGCELMEYFLQA